MEKQILENKDKILEIIKKTRDITLPNFGGFVFNEKENPRDLVTEFDILVEKYLKENFKTIFPEVDFVGEETGGDRTQETFWLIDPIDGTGHFVRGIAHCSTMVSLINEGSVIFSVIYDFVNDDMYFALKGEGAFKNGKRISVSNRTMKQAILGWEIKKTTDKGNLIRNYLENNFGYYNSLCAGMPLALVAEGKLDGLVFYDPFGNDYDFAAGSLLVAEAGGFVENINSSGYDYKNLDFIAANRNIGKNLKKELEQI